LLVRESPEEDLARLRSFEPLLEGGNEQRGRTLFFAVKTACSTCHRVAGQGGMVGPDLTKIGAIRSGRDLIESIVRPSSTFAQGYESYSLTLKDGSETDGIIARRNADFVVLRDSSGAERQFRSGQILEMKPKGLSIMPEGLDGTLSREEFRDLLAFLRGLR
jgi:putative heme-binding domain-containing protein